MYKRFEPNYLLMGPAQRQLEFYRNVDAASNFSRLSRIFMKKMEITLFVFSEFRMYEQADLAEL